MQRLSLSQLARAARTPSRVSFSSPIIRSSLASSRTYATSAPKEAESASGQSGGSRSKDAKEQAESKSASGSVEPTPAAKGRTGGGEPLGSSSDNAAPQPKVHNAKVPGEGQNLTKEQQEEVDRHNADFDKRYDRATPATQDKVDKKFWRDRGGAKNEN